MSDKSHTTLIGLMALTRTSPTRLSIADGARARSGPAVPARSSVRTLLRAGDGWGGAGRRKGGGGVSPRRPSLRRAVRRGPRPAVTRGLRGEGGTGRRCPTVWAALNIPLAAGARRQRPPPRPRLDPIGYPRGPGEGGPGLQAEVIIVLFWPCSGPPGRARAGPVCSVDATLRLHPSPGESLAHAAYGGHCLGHCKGHHDTLRLIQVLPARTRLLRSRSESQLLSIGVAATVPVLLALNTSPRPGGRRLVAGVRISGGSVCDSASDSVRQAAVLSAQVDLGGPRVQGDCYSETLQCSLLQCSLLQCSQCRLCALQCILSLIALVLLLTFDCHAVPCVLQFIKVSVGKDKLCRIRSTLAFKLTRDRC